MTDEERVVECQKEIRRLRGAVRKMQKENERLKTLLYNSIIYISKQYNLLDEYDSDGQQKWYEDTLDITAEELSSIGLNWFKEE